MEKVENEEMKKFLSSLSEGIGLIESQLGPDFFQDNNDVKKKKQKQQQNIAILK